MMKRYQLLTLLVAFGVGLGMATSASAIDNPVIDFGLGYACEGSRVVDGHMSVSGDTLVIVGHVAQFKDPFDDLDANDPSVEYTYVYDNLVSQGTVVIAGVIFDTDYTGGRLRVFCDPGQDADYADKSTFMNGTMILQADLVNFHIHTDAFGCSGTQNADVAAYSGGTLVDRVDGCSGAIITPFFTVCNSFVPDTQEGQGYFGMSDTKLDTCLPVPVHESTWGAIKKLYQN
jgi:hypothetical protein